MSTRYRRSDDEKWEGQKEHAADEPQRVRLRERAARRLGLRRRPAPAVPARTRLDRDYAGRNQQHVRDLLAGRDPQYARALDRTVRDLSPRTGRSPR